MCSSLVVSRDKEENQPESHPLSHKNPSQLNAHSIYRMSSRLPTLVGISQRLRRLAEAMSTENESLSNRSRSHRDEADTVLISRGLKAELWRLRSGVQAPVHITHYGVDRRPGCLPLVQPSRSRGTSVVPDPHRISSTCWAGRREVIRSVVYAVFRGAPPRRGLSQENVSMAAPQISTCFPNAIVHGGVPCTRSLSMKSPTNRIAKDK